MSVKTVVKVMNFHALLRVNSARRKVEQAHQYEQQLRKILFSIINNRIFQQEDVSLALPENAKELNIYIGSDWGFCASFNADVMRFLREDDAHNEKILIGKRIKLDAENIVLEMDKEEFNTRFNEIADLILGGILKKKYSKINIIYIHYYDLGRQEIVKRTILPFEYGKDVLDSEETAKISQDEDFVIEGDLDYILWNLISLYVSTEIKIAEAWSWASENVQRQLFTDQSLKKIEEREEEDLKVARKERRNLNFRALVEMNNKKLRMREQ